MVNYRGPKKEFTGPEAEQLRTKPHTRYMDPVTGDMIIYEIPKQETLTKQQREKEFDADIQRRKKYYDKNGRVIPTTVFPQTILDNVKTVTETTKTKPVNEVKRFNKLIHDLGNY